jgi:hypothetical protein
MIDEDNFELLTPILEDRGGVLDIRRPGCYGGGFVGANGGEGISTWMFVEMPKPPYDRGLKVLKCVVLFSLFNSCAE